MSEVLEVPEGSLTTGTSAIGLRLGYLPHEKNPTCFAWPFLIDIGLAPPVFAVVYKQIESRLKGDAGVF